MSNRYRKKAVEVEAVRASEIIDSVGAEHECLLPQWVIDGLKVDPETDEGHGGVSRLRAYKESGGFLEVRTKQGQWVCAGPTEWIVTAAPDDLWPVAAEVFAATYEPANQHPETQGDREALQGDIAIEVTGLLERAGLESAPTEFHTNCRDLENAAWLRGRDDTLALVREELDGYIAKGFELFAATQPVPETQGTRGSAEALAELMAAVEPFTVDGGVGCGSEEVDRLYEVYERIRQGRGSTDGGEGGSEPIYVGLKSLPIYSLPWIADGEPMLALSGGLRVRDVFDRAHGGDDLDAIAEDFGLPPTALQLLAELASLILATERDRLHRINATQSDHYTVDRVTEGAGDPAVVTDAMVADVMRARRGWHSGVRVNTDVSEALQIRADLEVALTQPTDVGEGGREPGVDRG